MKPVNLETAKELLEAYKNITLEDLEELFSENPTWDGHDVLNVITGFGNSDCMLCQSANCNCNACIYSFRLSIEYQTPCIDIIYNKIDYSQCAEQLFEAIQQRISYITHIIEWYENCN